MGDKNPVASVSVVVCTHTERRYELVRECLASMAANTVRPHEVIVVVDSNPALLQRLRADPLIDAQILASTGRGASAARNTGIAAATGELVAFIDDDAVAEPDWLGELCRPFADPDIVATGGRIVPRWERPNRLLPDELLWTVGSTYAGHPVHPQAITRPVGCNMAANRYALDKVGGFPVEFGPSGPAAMSASNTSTTPTSKVRRLPTPSWDATASATTRAGSGRTSMTTTSSSSEPRAPAMSWSCVAASTNATSPPSIWMATCCAAHSLSTEVKTSW